MKNIYKLFCGLVALTTTACNNDELTQMEQQPISPDGQVVSVTAYTPGSNANSRIDFTQGEGNAWLLNWSTNESFSVIRDEANTTFSKTTEGNIFTGTLPDGSSDCYAIYPTTSATDNTAVPMDLSSQTGRLESSKTYMRASLDKSTSSFQFSHLTAVLKTTFTGLPAGTKIKRIFVTTENSCVNPTVNLTDGTLSEPKKYNATKNIVINYATSLAYNNNEIYIYLPPMPANKKALTFEIITEQNEAYCGWLEATGTKEIVAGNVYAATGFALKKIDYFTLKANDNNSMKVSIVGDFTLSLQYSVDYGPWTNVTAGHPIGIGGSHGDLRLRAISPTGTATDISNYLNFNFSSHDALITCSGDIRTLVDWKNYDEAEMNNARFCSLFMGAKALTNIPVLPAETLPSYCYYNMFSGCTNLTEIPANLLPVQTLAEGCYQNMFSGCTNLTEIPANLLSAKTLANSCYQGMFLGCTGLTAIPEALLPVQILAEDCYQSMFSGCTGLTAIPEALLPATTLVAGCYQSMFSGCSSLNSITMMATSATESSLTDWLSGVASTGTLTKLALFQLPSGATPPEGWTITSIAPGIDAPDMEAGGEW